MNSHQSCNMYPFGWLQFLECQTNCSANIWAIKLFEFNKWSKHLIIMLCKESEPQSDLLSHSYGGQFKPCEMTIANKKWQYCSIPISIQNNIHTISKVWMAGHGFFKKKSFWFTITCELFNSMRKRCGAQKWILRNTELVKLFSVMVVNANSLKLAKYTNMYFIYTFFFLIFIYIIWKASHFFVWLFHLL